MERYKYKLYAIALLTLIALFVGVCWGGYRGAFTPTVPLHLRADRSGLQMDPGNRVLLRGVDVGTVAAVERAANGAGVDLTLDMKPGMIDKIPADARVSLDQLTAFGAKTVNINVPAGARGPVVQPGATLAAGRVTVEVNSVFDQLTRVLTDAQPAKVNAVLGGLADALRGRGDKIGETVEVLDGYLAKLNTDLPTLREDFRKGGQVADVYAAAAPDLMRLLDNGTVTARTIADRRDQLDRTLHQVTRVSGIGEDFLVTNGEDIIDVARNLRPTTGLLKKYAPMYPCFLQGLDVSNEQLITSQGNTVPGLVGLTTLVPGTDPYRYPDDLPNMRANSGPSCHGLPHWPGVDTPPGLDRNFSHGNPKNNKGDNTYRIGDPPLVTQLFGPAAVQPRNGAEEKREAERKQREKQREGGHR